MTGFTEKGMANVAAGPTHRTQNAGLLVGHFW